MKNLIQYTLQAILGFRNYCFLFSIFRIVTLNWDKKENHFLHFLELMENKGMVLDIGANIGIMTVRIARKAPAASVIAFEPIPTNTDTLRRIVQYFKLKQVSIMPIALGDGNREVEMVMPVIGRTRKQGLSHIVDNESNYNIGLRYTVAMKMLDDVVEANNPASPVMAIKIDVENAEFQVLHGGKNLLKRDKPLIYCELWDNENRRKTIDLLKGLGYQVKVFKKKALVDYDRPDTSVQNFFFIP